MNKSESIKEIAVALNKFEGEFTNVKMESTNPFFKSKYADLATIWDSIRPLLSKHGLSVIQGADGMNDSGHIFYNTTILHTSGEWMSYCVPIKPTKDDPQGMGSAITYARRYGLSAMLGIVADEDDDAGGDKKNTPPATKPDSKPPARVSSPPKQEVSSKTPVGDIPAMKTLTDMQKMVHKEFNLQPKAQLEMLGCRTWADVTDTPQEAYAKIKEKMAEDKLDPEDIPF